METKIEVTSEQYKLDWKDLGKGLLVSVATAVLFVVQDALDAGELEFNWKTIGKAAIAAAVGYLIKNFFTPAKIQSPK